MLWLRDRGTMNDSDQVQDECGVGVDIERNLPGVEGGSLAYYIHSIAEHEDGQSLHRVRSMRIEALALDFALMRQG